MGVAAREITSPALLAHAFIGSCRDIDDRCSNTTTTARLGTRRALAVAAACHAATLGALAAVGLVYPLGPVYFAGVGLAAGLLTRRALGGAARIDAFSARIKPWSMIGLVATVAIVGIYLSTPPVAST